MSGILFVSQAIVGALIVTLDQSAFIAGIHLAIAAAIWGTLAILAALAFNQAHGVAGSGASRRISACLMLMLPTTRWR